jgi:hypothetical protein
MSESGRLPASFGVLPSAPGSSRTTFFRSSVAIFSVLYAACVFFVGDYYINDLEMHAFWVLSVFGIWSFSSVRYAATRYAFVIFFPACLIISIGIIYKQIELSYYNSLGFIMIAILFVAIVKDQLSIALGPLAICSAGVLIAFAFYVYNAHTESTRVTLLFGPTILYRVVLFFYGIAAACCIARNMSAASILLAVVAFYAIYKIGSRGGIVALVAMWLVMLRVTGALRFKTLLLGVVLAAFFISYSDVFLGSRTFYFSSDSESSNVRIDKLAAAYDYIASPSVWLGMVEPSKLVGNYPHNIFAEFLVFHGLFATLLLIFYSSALPLVILDGGRRYPACFNLIIIFMPIIIGAQFSGSLIDNYAYVAFLCYIWGELLRTWVLDRKVNSGQLEALKCSR